MNNTQTHNAHIQTLRNKRIELWTNFWALNYAYITMIVCFLIINWFITNNLNEMSSPEKIFNGWIVGYDDYLDPNTELYHLNMHGESSDRRTCIYHDYFVGSEIMVNILVEKNTHTEIKWAYDPVTKDCSKNNYSDLNDKIVGFGNFAVAFVALIIGWIYLMLMFTVFDNCYKFSFWFVLFGYCLTMWAVCANIFYPPNNDLDKRSIERFKYLFNWGVGIFVNYWILYFELKSMKEEYVNLNSENVTSESREHRHGCGHGHRYNYGSTGNAQCAEFEE